MAGKKSKRKQVHVKTPFSSSKHPSSHPPASDSEVGLCSSNPTDAACDPHSSVDASVKMCRHLEKGIDVDKLSSQVFKSKFSITHCHDCAKESKSGAVKKGKGRSNRKKESAVTADSAVHLQKKWVCLACGHVACGAFAIHSGKRPKEQEGNMQNEKDTVAPTGHVCKHSLCSRHPLAFQTTDNLVWCFLCNMAVDFKASSGSVDGNSLSSSRGPLQEALKVVHEKLVTETGFLKDPGKEVSTGDLVRYNVNDATQSNGLGSTPILSMQIIGTRRKRIVKGLMNLGNTCFFNSVMQNLLALDMLRDYFNQDFPGMEGPLTSSLRKLYMETNLDGAGQLCMGNSESSGFESGLKKGGKGRAAWESVGSACNPRSLFGAICAKAPRFRGFQQQDSHELLRCLLDGLTSEERSARAKSTCSGDIKGTSHLVTNCLLMQNGETISAEPLKREKESRSLEATTSPSVTATTFVESFFGGQLCSTVRCCECGHSSIVFEPMLDLSLQIPNRKKGEVCANQSKLLSSGGEPHQGKHTKALPKTSLHGLSQAAGSAVVDRSKSSLQGGQSAQAGSTSVSSPTGTPKHATIDNASDFGWLDFISGGIQSAESSVQGSCDVLNTTEVSESNLAVPLIESNAANTDSAASISSIMNAEADLSKDACQSAMARPVEHDNKPHIERLEVGTSLNWKEEEVEKSLALSEGEDGPLPLASGILLLPYEPLEMSSSSSGEQSIAFMELAPNCSSLDMSSPLTEPEGGFLDGFSQLFEEEESCFTASESMKPSGSNLEDSQVIEESAWDDESWDADTSVYNKGEAAAHLEDAFLPMSLEGCLADFTKPELLCGENAWECESCTRRMKEKASSVNRNGNIESPKDVNVGEKHKKQELKLLKKDYIDGHLFSCSENGVPGQVLQEVCEATSGGDNGSVKGSSSVHLVVDRTVNENENGGGHLIKSDDGQHPVSQPPSCQADGKVNVTMETLLSADHVAGTPNLETHSESNVQCNGHNTSAFKSSVKGAGQIGCSDVKCAGLVNKENLTTSQNKFTKETKSKIKIRQPPEKLMKKDATKKLSICKAPPILTVHLKRFAQDMRGRLSKLSGHVTFPEILDLRPFLDPRCLDSKSCFYQLVGVVEHGGTMRGGHYIAYVRSPGLEEAVDGAEQESKDDWYYVSDSSVHKASLQAVLNSEAYLLFYEKCNVNAAYEL